MSELFEVIMVVCFGISWPASIVKSYRSRSTKGKSLFFLFLVWIGYLFGIASKLLNNNITYVVCFYILNFVMVSLDIGLYLRNSRL